MVLANGPIMFLPEQQVPMQLPAIHVTTNRPMTGLAALLQMCIAIHNIPEGLAISLVLVPRGTSVRAAAGWSIFSSLPQPLLAVPAYLFVEKFKPILPAGLGFAAGAMVWLVVSELIPDAHFSTFLKIFTDKNSTTTPITPIGQDHLQTFSNFLAKWYAGKVSNLQAGLAAVDKTIDAKIELYRERIGC